MNEPRPKDDNRSWIYFLYCLAVITVCLVVFDIGLKHVVDTKKEAKEKADNNSADWELVHSMMDENVRLSLENLDLQKQLREARDSIMYSIKQGGIINVVPAQEFHSMFLMWKKAQDSVDILQKQIKSK